MNQSEIAGAVRDAVAEAVGREPDVVTAESTTTADPGPVSNSPVDGLRLAGHWSQAAGALRVFGSGGQAAQHISRATGRGDVGAEL